MTESQFTLRLMLTIAIGIAFLIVMAKMAIRNSVPTTKTPTALKVLGWVFVAFGAIAGVVGIISLFSLEHSSETMEVITGIVRPSSATLYWGFPNTGQNMSLSNFMNLFVMMGYGIYFLKFKPSKVAWWQKMLKVISLIVIMFLIYSSTNLHYFDWWELWPNILLIVIIYCNFKFVGKQSDTITESIATPTEVHQNVTTVIAKEKRNDDVIFETEDVEL